MTIERQYRLTNLVCDCGVRQRGSYRPDQFEEMIADARRDGWRIRKVAGEWEHDCPDCAAQPPKQRSLL